MPRIVPYERKVEEKASFPSGGIVPTTGLRPQPAITAVPAAIGQIGKAIGDIGELILIQVQKRNERLKALAAEDYKNEYKAEGLQKIVDIKSSLGEEAVAKYNEWVERKKELLKSNVIDSNIFKKPIYRGLKFTKEDLMSVALDRDRYLNEIDKDLSLYRANQELTVFFQRKDESRNTILQDSLVRETLDLDTAISELKTIYENSNRPKSDWGIHFLENQQKLATAWLDKKFNEGNPDVIKDFLNDKYNRYFQFNSDQIDEFSDKAKKASKNEIVEAATVFVQEKFTKPDGTIDIPNAAIFISKPANLKGFPGLSIDDSQNIVTTLKNISSAQEIIKKDKQSANMDRIYDIATDNMPKAILEARKLNINDADPKEVLQFIKTAESHIQSMSLMSVQEKAERAKLEDTAMTNIEINIRRGLYKAEREVQNAVLEAGLTKSAPFMEKAINAYRDEEKRRGEVDYFKAAEDDWKIWANLPRSRATKAERLEKLLQIQKSLNTYMKDNNLQANDERVFKKYEEIKKNLTTGMWEKLWGDWSSFVTKPFWGEDTMIKTVPVIKQPPLYNEDAIRRDLRTGKREVFKNGKWVGM
ncbi:MAG: hypothetical protein Q8J68_14755 [Methanolobus sp.]|uniref:hypothetical protein n=1 Tax=Methanolobus sp. TaxID=1874737 RepID=UPI002730E247|nr:hypothetical protein [Methanolobus sp.]MDP2218535.1 hypothetical protein [Methanolobus sp.]